MGYMNIVVFAVLMATTFSYPVLSDSATYTICLQGDPDAILTTEVRTKIRKDAATFGCTMPQVQELGGQEQVWEEYGVFFVRLTCVSGGISLPEYKRTLEIEHVPVSSIVEGTEMSISDEVLSGDASGTAPTSSSSENDETGDRNLLFFETSGGY